MPGHELAIWLARLRRSASNSIWVFDHFHTVPRPTEEITFESFTTLGGPRAGDTPSSARPRRSVRRISKSGTHRKDDFDARRDQDGRMELGLGAGWKRDEWLAYGYGFPDAPERLAILNDQLEVSRAMMSEGPRHVSGRAPLGRERHQPAAADPEAAGADHGRRQRPERDLATRRALRRRAERRWPDAGRGRRGAAGDRAPVRGDRPRPVLADGLGPRLVGALERDRPAASRPAAANTRGSGHRG